jgi:hypothetical protein
VSAFRNYYEFLALSDPELTRIDPVLMNLLVARSIPALAGLDIARYQALADGWADGVRQRLPHAERVFQRDPGRWKNDINFVRLAVLCEHLDCQVGLAYNETQKSVTRIRYTNPSDLFLNGVMDSRRGTCGNLATVHVALAWRLGWPVSLACVRSHFVARYNDGDGAGRLVLPNGPGVDATGGIAARGCALWIRPPGADAA